MLRDLLAETGAGAVFWTRYWEPEARRRDEAVKAALAGQGTEARGFAGLTVFDPWTVATGQGTPFRVFTPFWRAIRDRDPGTPLPAPRALHPPEAWPSTEVLSDWAMGAAMNRGAEVVAGHARVGEAAAEARLEAFLGGAIEAYAKARDFPARNGTSRLSENLAWGEISPRALWSVALAAHEAGAAGAEAFLRELAWREFAWSLLCHTPHIATESWREEWRDFPWDASEHRPEVTAWKRGQTGVPLVDAALREMWVTGTMHNRARMVAASYLTKNLMADWRIGQRWLADCLIDWDPAANAMGWQWVAGSGPDAAPWFRIFNPMAQADRFDPDGAYRNRWLAEGQATPPETALAFFKAVPRRWGLRADRPSTRPGAGLAEGRRRALAAHEHWKRG